MKVPVHAPAVSVGVPDDPVLGLGLLVDAPTDHEDRVVQLLAGHLGRLLCLSLWECTVRLSLRQGHFSVFGHENLRLRRCGQDVLAENAFVVHLEFVVSVELRHERTVHKHFFLDQLFARGKVVASHVVAGDYFGYPWTLFVVVTSVPLGNTFVRRALFRDHMAILGKESVEDGPTTCTALVHIVAHEQELGRKLRDWLLFVGVFEL